MAATDPSSTTTDAAAAAAVAPWRRKAAAAEAAHRAAVEAAAVVVAEVDDGIERASFRHRRSEAEAGPKLETPRGATGTAVVAAAVAAAAAASLVLHALMSAVERQRDLVGETIREKTAKHLSANFWRRKKKRKNRRHEIRRGLSRHHYHRRRVAEGRRHLSRPNRAKTIAAPFLGRK